MEQWKIQRDRKMQGRCSKCATPLALQEYVALLRLPECVRQDVCQPCFSEMGRAADELPFHWRVLRKPSGKKQAVLDLTGLRVLFDRLGAVEANSQEDGDGDGLATDNASALRYLIALILLRKRILKMADARNEAEERADLLVFDPKLEGMEPVALSAPDLEGDGLQELREELLSMAGLTSAPEEGEVQTG